MASAQTATLPRGLSLRRLVIAAELVELVELVGKDDAAQVNNFEPSRLSSVPDGAPPVPSSTPSCQEMP